MTIRRERIPHFADYEDRAVDVVSAPYCKDNFMALALTKKLKIEVPKIECEEDFFLIPSIKRTFCGR